MTRVDLHVHSTASDGSLAPADVVAAARDAGLSAIALTDHDTTAGLAAAQDAGARLGVDVVAGIEFSVKVGEGSAHVLGYGFDPDHAALRAIIDRASASRATRNPLIVARLNDLGVPLTLEEVEAVARRAPGNASVGRPHVAQALVEADVVATIAEAFDRYLAAGRPAYVPRPPLAHGDAIDALHAAGGVAVCAHPVTLPEPRRRDLLEEMVRAGLDGVEVVHSKQDEAVRRWLAAFADEHRLLATGGSDFHGTPKPEVRIGSGVDGNVNVPRAVLDVVLERTANR